MDHDEKMRRARALALARNQEVAEIARMRREGVPAQRGTVETDLHPNNPNRPKTNDN